MMIKVLKRHWTGSYTYFDWLSSQWTFRFTPGCPKGVRGSVTPIHEKANLCQFTRNLSRSCTYTGCTHHKASEREESPPFATATLNFWGETSVLIKNLRVLFESLWAWGNGILEQPIYPCAEKYWIKWWLFLFQKRDPRRQKSGWINCAPQLVSWNNAFMMRLQARRNTPISIRWHRALKSS